MSLLEHRAWLITDGKIGDEQQCIGIAHALQVNYKLIHVKPSRFFAFFMPYGPTDPQEHHKIAPPYPDMAIASGRRAVAYLRKIKRASQGRCFTVFLKDPRTGLKTADFIWVPEHDRLRGINVLTTLTSPHALDLSQIVIDPRLNSTKTPRVAVLLGGNSSAYTFTEADCARFAAHLTSIAQSGAYLMVSASRRTPNILRHTITQVCAHHDGFFWDGTGDNPLQSMLSCANTIVTTADSVNMVGEAVSTGKPVLVFKPTGGSRKTDYFLNKLTTMNAIKPLTRELISWSYSPINATPIIAAEIEKQYLEFRKTL